MKNSDNFETCDLQIEILKRAAQDPFRPFDPPVIDKGKNYTPEDVLEMVDGLYLQAAAAIARSARRYLPKPRAVDLRATEPWQRRLRIDEGFTQNYVQVLSVERVESKYYEGVSRWRMRSTGRLFCVCLACGRGGLPSNEGEDDSWWAVARSRLSLNPARSLYSCGCKKRPRKGCSEVRETHSERTSRRTGLPVADLWDERFGRLVVIGHRLGFGWRCKCDCGRQCYRGTNALRRGERAKRMQCCGRECPLTVRGFTRAKYAPP